MRLWLWKNFVDGKPEYWAFDNPFPVHLDCGDPQTLGEPCGYAIFKESRNGRPDVPEEEVLCRIVDSQPINEMLDGIDADFAAAGRTIERLEANLEMAERRGADLVADNARLRVALTEAHETIGDDIEPYEVAKRRIDALAATPAESLDALLAPYKTRIERLEAEDKQLATALAREAELIACVNQLWEALDDCRGWLQCDHDGQRRSRDRAQEVLNNTESIKGEKLAVHVIDQ